MKTTRSARRWLTRFPLFVGMIAILVGCHHRHRHHDVPPPPPFPAYCLGDLFIGDIVEWEADMDYPGDVDEFLVDPGEVPMELNVRVFGAFYGVDTVFEIFDPFGNLIDVVDDRIGLDPEGSYILDVCGPWTIRVYAFDADVGPYDLLVEAY